jgi:hypothetical protein
MLPAAPARLSPPSPTGPRLPPRDVWRDHSLPPLKTFLKSFVLLTALGGFTRTVVACDSCALYIAEGAETSGYTLSVAQQFTRLGTVWSGDQRLGNPVNQYLDSHITQLAVGYSHGGPWQVQFTLPYISRSFVRPEHDLIEHGRASGLGDATLAGSYRIWQITTAHGDKFTATLVGGVELATGDADHLGDEIGEDEHSHENLPDSGVHGHDLALGSGSTDYLLGVDAGWVRGRLFVRGQLQSNFRRPGAFY